MKVLIIEDNDSKLEEKITYSNFLRVEPDSIRGGIFNENEKSFMHRDILCDVTFDVCTACIGIRG